MEYDFTEEQADRISEEIDPQYAEAWVQGFGGFEIPRMEEDE